MTQHFPDCLPTPVEGFALRRLAPEHVEELVTLIEHNKGYLNDLGNPIGADYKTRGELIAEYENPERPETIRYGIWYRELLIGLAELRTTSDAIHGTVDAWTVPAHSGNGYTAAAIDRICKAAEAAGLVEVRAKVRTWDSGAFERLTSIGFSFDKRKNQLSSEAAYTVRADADFVIRNDGFNYYLRKLKPSP